MSFYVRKASGKKELFDIKKFTRSLKRAGADEATITSIIQQLNKIPEMKSTREIYDFALQALHKKNAPLAARYNIKRALLELGPSGFPFERFIAALFKEQGYTTKLNQEAEGFCISHELDIVAHKNDTHDMIECKFHNRQGLKTDVKVALYIKARFDDMEKVWRNDKKHTDTFHHAWIATNTRFTSQAIQYAKCVNIKLLGWSYPRVNNIPHLINKLKLHPITALVSLNRSQKKAFINDGLVLCRDARKHIALLKRLGFSSHQIKKLIKESEGVCQLPTQ